MGIITPLTGTYLRSTFQTGRSCAQFVLLTLMFISMRYPISNIVCWPVWITTGNGAVVWGAALRSDDRFVFELQRHSSYPIPISRRPLVSTMLTYISQCILLPFFVTHSLACLRNNRVVHSPTHRASPLSCCPQSKCRTYDTAEAPAWPKSSPTRCVHVCVGFIVFHCVPSLGRLRVPSRWISKESCGHSCCMDRGDTQHRHVFVCVPGCKLCQSWKRGGQALLPQKHPRKTHPGAIALTE